MIALLSFLSIATHKSLSKHFKASCLKNRKAVDSGKQSGGDRVLATFYDFCQHIWKGGSPAGEMIENGVETSELRRWCRQSKIAKRTKLGLKIKSKAGILVKGYHH